MSLSGQAVRRCHVVHRLIITNWGDCQQPELQRTLRRLRDLVDRTNSEFH